MTVFKRYPPLSLPLARTPLLWRCALLAVLPLAMVAVALAHPDPKVETVAAADLVFDIRTDQDTGAACVAHVDGDWPMTLDHLRC